MLKDMKTSYRSLILAFLLIAAALLGTAAARAQTVITSLPYTITGSGLYVLNSNLSSPATSGNLITVNVSNVTIDFQNHFISGPVGNTSQTTYGIYAYEQSNLTIKNGTIAHCFAGISIDGNDEGDTNSLDHQIDNMRVTHCSSYGIYLRASPASRITNCQVSQIGYSGANVAYGIAAYNDGTTISGSVISTVTATTAYGILAGTGSFARQNTVSYAGYGVYGGKYQDNLTTGCTYPYSGGTDAGGNN